MGSVAEAQQPYTIPLRIAPKPQQEKQSPRTNHLPEGGARRSVERGRRGIHLGPPQAKQCTHHHHPAAVHAQPQQPKESQKQDYTANSDAQTELSQQTMQERENAGRNNVGTEASARHGKILRIAREAEVENSATSRRRAHGEQSAATRKHQEQRRSVGD